MLASQPPNRLPTIAPEERVICVQAFTLGSPLASLPLAWETESAQGISQAALTATIDRIDEVQAAISASLKTLMERTSSIDAELTSLLQGNRAVAVAAE